ncbi:hypothetical protein J1N09_09195 [Aureitalea sp. L0-47]|uniref:DUF6252 family protein n=1 Tax=Aureitalea sp. L0-47 TaxID=2816962 RepID=UPI0022371F3B|nr:DUF6252 family protein [Aureitalea sp. L0-47]MCW5520012.1 hypothetical protein [Aureitalea sp. L0-47]
MKTLKTSIYYMFLCLSLVLTACSSDDDNANNNQQNNGSGELFTAKIDGTDFAASMDPATLIGGTKSTANGMTVVSGQGSTNSGDFINFNIIGYNGPGTYKTGDNLTNPNALQYGELAGQSANVWASNLATSAAGIAPGTIEITVDADGKIEGTFSFEGYNAQDMTSKMITQGQFKFSID